MFIAVATCPVLNVFLGEVHDASKRPRKPMPAPPRLDSINFIANNLTAAISVQFVILKDNVPINESV